MTARAPASAFPHLLALLLDAGVQIRPSEEVSGKAQDVLRLVLQDLVDEDADHVPDLGVRLEVALVLHVDLDLREVQPLLLLGGQLSGLRIVFAGIGRAESGPGGARGLGLFRALGHSACAARAGSGLGRLGTAWARRW
eukprot:CAMPEP_0170297822 /NCGR_PEP_ID=MMETSP0116_2-20130129/49075_1 /TAXON_ID=400756 /ORGANISM="Durinskia baltica, Strain CSIRO CS-38" /LENGTH=138 /DNA_ID=CAMNT_0010549453 /DNA_START=70 /DNA_END=483 /DNA_ORIENTATION=+